MSNRNTLNGHDAEPSGQRAASVVTKAKNRSDGTNRRKDHMKTVRATVVERMEVIEQSCGR